MKALLGFFLAFLLISIPVAAQNKGGGKSRSAPGVGGGHVPARGPAPHPGPAPAARSAPTSNARPAPESNARPAPAPAPRSQEQRGGAPQEQVRNNSDMKGHP